MAWIYNHKACTGESTPEYVDRVSRSINTCNHYMQRDWDVEWSQHKQRESKHDDGQRASEQDTFEMTLIASRFRAHGGKQSREHAAHWPVATDTHVAPTRKREGATKHRGSDTLSCRVLSLLQAALVGASDSSAP